ncbi:hypothetical protein FVD38_13845 [Massilia arenae]|uniref:Flagellin C-terminal domain-containing protein n=2 Tax=Massilia arenae TaxID=2603288 RepID=A0A5C7FWR7_9BURK|nr:hypothetical protein FVD38_13845 [Massilia arenae]
MARWDYDEVDGVADPDGKAAAYGAMIDKKNELAAAKDAYAKAETAVTAATKYNNAVTAAADPDGEGGKLTAELSFQIGASSSETMKLDLSTQVTGMHNALKDISGKYNAFGAADATGVPGTELTDADVTNGMVDMLQNAIDSLGSVRSSLGAAANRLDHANTNLANISANTQAASGRIMDVDFATESASMTSSQMLLQAGTAMLKQSNSMSSMVMSLLQ